MALYRKYRPATFGEVVGQEHVTRPLSAALDSRGADGRPDRINHAYLFSGPRGCGKTSSARILARSLNCVEGPTSTPCGECGSCVALGPGGAGTLDVVELDAASHNSVDNMRDLRDKAGYAPADARYRIFIIDEAHMVSNQGFNALLKIVEEPPEHVIFVFATTEPEKVIPTIRSRTHHYPFRLLPPSVMRGLLQRIIDEEGVPVEPSVLPLVIRAGAGSPRDCLSVLDQLLAGAGPDGVDHRLAAGLLGVTDETLIDDAVTALAGMDRAGLFDCVDRVVESGQDPRRFAEDLLTRMRDLIMVQAVPDAVQRGLVDAMGERAPLLAQQAQAMPPAAATRFAQVLVAGLSEMSGATAPRLLLEVVCARMLLPAASGDPEALLQRVEALERGGVAAAPAPADAPAAPAAGAPDPAPAPPGADAAGRTGAELALAKLKAMRGEEPAAPAAESAPAAQAASGAGQAEGPDPEERARRAREAREAARRLQEAAREQERQERHREAMAREAAARRADSAAAPEPEPAAEPDPAPAPVPESAPEPASERVPEPASEPAPEPAPEPMAEPEPAPEPAPEAGPAPEAVAEPDAAPIPEPESEPQPESAATGGAAPEPAADSGPGSGELDVAALRRSWPEVMAAVAGDALPVRVMASAATPLEFTGEELVIGHHTGALANRLNAEDNAAALGEAIHRVHGVRPRVRAVVGQARPAARPRQRNADPAEASEAPADADGGPEPAYRRLLERRRARTRPADPAPAAPAEPAASPIEELRRRYRPAGAAPAAAPAPDEPPPPPEPFDPGMEEAPPPPDEPADPAELDAMLDDAPGERDHRDLRQVVMDFLAEELGARPL